MVRVCCEPVLHVVRRVNGRGDASDDVAVPPVNVWHDEQAMYVEVDAPGCRPEDLDITASNEALIIRGRRHAPAERRRENQFPCERRARTIERTIPLPFRIDKERTIAESRDGVLFITLPRPKAESPQKIKIQVG